MTPQVSKNRQLTDSKVWTRLQALVYDILPPAIAIPDDAPGLEKASANGRFFVGDQMAVGLYETIKIISGFVL